MFFRTTVIAALLAAPSVLGATLGKRDHSIVFHNNCPNKITPMLHAVDGSFKALKELGHGESVSTSVPEGVRLAFLPLFASPELTRTQWHAGRAFGQDGKCSKPDGDHCTLLECDFSNPGFRQCNLSRVSGYNIPMGFSFDAPGCGSNRCASASCGGDQAFSTENNGGKSLRQCNNANVGMQ
jgi:hypothetical protein